MTGRPATPLAQRFWPKVAISSPDECWEWQGTCDRSGYGLINRGRELRRLRAHRVAYELVRGPIPGGLIVCHSCDNPSCCNPAHLFLGTNVENALDRDAKRRHFRHAQTHCKHGHEFTPENTMPRRRGGKISGRICRVCHRVQHAKASSMATVALAMLWAQVLS